VQPHRSCIGQAGHLPAFDRFTKRAFDWVEALRTLLRQVEIEAGLGR